MIEIISNIHLNCIYEVDENACICVCEIVDAKNGGYSEPSSARPSLF